MDNLNETSVQGAFVFLQMSLRSIISLKNHSSYRLGEEIWLWNSWLKYLSEIAPDSKITQNISRDHKISQNISKYIGKSQNILFNINCGIPCSQTSHYTQNLRNLKIFIHKVTVPMKNYFYVVFWCFCAILKSLEDQLVLHESIHHINR